MKFPGKIRKTAACFLLFCIVLACIPVHAEENEAVEISAPSGVLMEPETKTILYEKDKDTRRSPASVTKVMTLLLIFDHLKDGSLKLTDTVTTSAHAKSMGGSQGCLEEGETQDVETMINKLKEKGTITTVTKQVIFEEPPTVSPELVSIQEQLKVRLGTQVRIKSSGKKGKIEIEFYGRDDLKRVLDALGGEFY